jgi:hypothetical protein
MNNEAILQQKPRKIEPDEPSGSGNKDTFHMTALNVAVKVTAVRLA